jgi:hypothetical protein
MSVTAYEWLTLAIGIVLPALAELVCHRLAAPGFKAIVLLILAALYGVAVVALGAVSSHATWDWSQAVFLGMTGFGTAVLVREGLLHPLGLTGKDGVIQRKVPVGARGPRKGVKRHSDQAPQ